MPTWLVNDPVFLDHDTGRHVECRERLEGITAHLSERGLLGPERLVAPQASEDAAIESVHGAEHLALVRRCSASGGGMLDPDTVCAAASFRVAQLAAGSACALADRVLGQPGRAAGLALCRPPGHHATPQRAMGFCLFNNMAILTRHLQRSHGLRKVMIVDWDVHHGNGTQDVFYDDPDVFFYSMHRYPFYPGSGAKHERGSGGGEGTTFNLPLAGDTRRGAVLDGFEQSVTRAAESFGPEIILISAGFDAYKADPVGGLGLEIEDFSRLTDVVAGLAAATSSAKLISLLEGGYHLEALPRMVAGHLVRLDAFSEA